MDDQRRGCWAPVPHVEHVRTGGAAPGVLSALWREPAHSGLAQSAGRGGAALQFLGSPRGPWTHADGPGSYSMQKCAAVPALPFQPTGDDDALDVQPVLRNGEVRGQTPALRIMDLDSHVLWDGASSARAAGLRIRRPSFLRGGGIFSETYRRRRGQGARVLALAVGKCNIQLRRWQCWPPAGSNPPTSTLTSVGCGPVPANEAGLRSPLVSPWRPAGSRAGRLVVLA